MSTQAVAPEGGHETRTGGERNSATPRARQPLPQAVGAASGSRGQQRRQARRHTRRPWWRGPLPLIGTIALVLVAVGVFAVIAHQTSDSALIDQPAAASVLHQVVAVSPSVLSAVGGGKLPNGNLMPTALHAISGPSLLTGGKPQVLYVGADFCPVCAAARWSLVNALSRFGAFSNLRYMRSAVGDGDLATFTFHGGGYTSPYLSFVAIENEDRAGHQLESLTDAQAQLFSTLGGSGYPFVDIAGQYINRAPNTYAGGFNQNILSGKDWTQIGGALGAAHDPITQGIVGSANNLTAAICRVTHNQPASACATSTLSAIERQLTAATTS